MYEMRFTADLVDDHGAVMAAANPSERGVSMVTKLLARTYRLAVFINVGRPLFLISRVDRLEPLALRWARALAWVVHKTLGRRTPTSVGDLAQEWNRLMPEPRSTFPVVAVDGDTAFVEIRIRCPLRGTGDAEACWRSMEFDRALMRASGGALVVMQSQAVTGQPFCKLAIRRTGADFSDLPVAHPRWRQRG